MSVITYPDVNHILGIYVPKMRLDRTRTPIDMELFETAMRHHSVSKNNYERLEYLGDAVYHAIISDYLYRRYEEESEGVLTVIRIKMEKSKTMARHARILKLDEFVQCREEITQSILEDVYEAFVGAFYINYGFQCTMKLVVGIIEKHENIAQLISTENNYKGLILRYFHRNGWGNPEYSREIRRQDGERMVYSELIGKDGKVVGRGTGSDDKRADQAASKSALKKFKVIVDGEIDDSWEEDIVKVKKKRKDDKDNSEKLSVFNPENLLLNRRAVRLIIRNYGVLLPREAKINLKLFHQATTHRSYLTRRGISAEEKAHSKGCVPLQTRSNERIRFLGNAVQRLFLSDYLYHLYPRAREGKLSTLRARLEGKNIVANLSIQSEVEPFLLVSSVVQVIHGRTPALQAGVYEAFLGALYLDQGYEVARLFGLSVVKTEVNMNDIEAVDVDYKVLVIQWCNRRGMGSPSYSLISRTGPDHRLVFECGLIIRGETVAIGEANTKTLAEQRAAELFWSEMSNH